MWHTKMQFPAKCNSGHIAIQWFHIKHYLDYQYTKFQPYTFRVQNMCVFARYATLVPRLLGNIANSFLVLSFFRGVNKSAVTIDGDLVFIYLSFFYYYCNKL